MKTLSDEAINILKNATKERKAANLPHDRNTIAKLYDTWPNIVVGALYAPGYELGSKTARKIIRAEMEHIKARKRGEMLETLEKTLTYKGNRTV